MYNKFLEKIEFYKILNKLSSFCETEIGKEISLSLHPSFTFEEVSYKLEETSEAFILLNTLENSTYIFTKNIEFITKKINSNSSLNTTELLNIANILKSSRILKENFYKSGDSFLNLEKTFSKLYSNNKIEEIIFSKILDEHTIDDYASNNLYSIRTKKRTIEKNIKDSLNSFIHSSHSKYIQDPVITIRNNRYVVPIKEEYRGIVKGFIHDISKTSSTLFIEPISIFELNNDLNHIISEEKQEIEKILDELSALISPIIQEIEKTSMVIGNIDFIFAKVHFAEFLNGTKPKLTKEKNFSLIKACHPLINKENVVPIDLYLGKDFNSLIITGPNTGGKTVVLKTCSLLLSMAYCGLYITASEETNICIFDNIFIDIGDEQSIEESLSTFSSHMTNIISIIQHATSNSLVLIDELGSGTDPLEGSSLALSILDYFNNLGCLTLATTHYPEIKNYCLITDGFENACVEFDFKTLKPTYRLLIGIPGKSNAFEISKRLGLSDNILEKAKTFLKPDTINIEELLKNIYDDKTTIENEKIKIQKESDEINNIKKSYEQEKKKIDEKKEKILENAEYEARIILSNAKKQVAAAIKEIDNSSSKTLNTIRNELNSSIKNTYSINNIDNTETDASSNQKDFNQHLLKKGDTVFVTSLNQNGIVLTDPTKAKKVQVQVGPAKLNINISDLLFVSDIKNKKNTSTTKTTLMKNKSYSMEINVIGNTVEEAIFLIDKFLDDCVIANLKSVRIVHGKGTGALKNGIHTFLKKHPHVESFRLGTFGEGEMGVTVVNLK